MNIWVNGEPRLISVGTSLDGLLDLLKLPKVGVAAALDAEVVHKRTWPETILAEGQRVEILTISQGG
ncbi:MAG: sulfur carrier protein ThiS [Acidimicrobiaceae bacterium]|nr:sulfur carrier protein ThiS [Acidimicrobiaceae bacterium]